MTRPRRPPTGTPSAICQNDARGRTLNRSVRYGGDQDGDHGPLTCEFAARTGLHITPRGQR